MTGASELESVMRYHERTKHHFYRFAAGPGRLDWANQPNPFRRYAGATLAPTAKAVHLVAVNLRPSHLDPGVGL